MTQDPATRTMVRGGPALSKHIGIAAVSPEGASLCYRQLSRHAARRLAPDDHPRISIHNEPLAHYIRAVQSQDWHEVGNLLRGSAEKLAGAGAQVCITPDNAVLHGVHLAEAGSPIPWLAMTDLVGRAVEGDGRKTVGVIGTKIVTSGSVYQTHLGLRGIKVLSSPEEDADRLDRIIFEELIYGRVDPGSREAVLEIVRSLGDRGAEGVILASSEVPLVVTPENSPLPVYDASDILAGGAIEYAAV